MWTCSKCGEVIEDQFDSCWKCAGQPEPGSSAAPRISYVPARFVVAAALNLFLLMRLQDLGRFSTSGAQVSKQFSLAAISAFTLVVLVPTIWRAGWWQRLAGAMLCVIPVFFLSWAIADHFGW